MDEYRKILVLEYFDNAKDEYTIKELFTRLGLEMENGNKLLDIMFEEELIYYSEYLIKITPKGKKILNAQPNNYFNIEDGNIVIHELLPKLKIDDIYIPNKF